MHKPSCQKGESSSPGIPDFETLVHDWETKIFRYALLSLRDRDAAQTVTQDCLLRVWQSLGSFRGECSLQTWLMRIAVNLVRDHLRNRRLQFWKRIRPATIALEHYAGDGGLGRSPEAAVVMRQNAEAVWSAANDLPERQRLVLLLRFVEDMDILEIVEATGMREGTVKTHLFRAVRFLRKRLGAQL